MHFLDKIVSFVLIRIEKYPCLLNNVYTKLNKNKEKSMVDRMGHTTSVPIMDAGQLF